MRIYLPEQVIFIEASVILTFSSRQILMSTEIEVKTCFVICFFNCK